MIARNIKVCRQCNMSPPRCGGHCPCKVDHREILDHAKANYCPLGKFGTTAKPDGWVAGLPIQEISDDFDPEQERRRLQQGGCCGEPSTG